MRARVLTFLLCLLTLPITAKTRQIKHVSPINITVTKGNVPSLPWRVWVTYNDGHCEWRQTRWNNAQPQTEQELAQRPVGTQYTIQGFILGDNTQAQGFPIEAAVKVVDQPAKAPDLVANTLPLNAVHITGNTLLSRNRDRDIEALLALDITQQLYNYRDTYGLPTAGYTESDGWDSPTTKLKGHGTGHYMSALAMGFASATKAWQRDSLRSRICRIVDELRLCQERTFIYDPTLGRYREARDLAPEAELPLLKGTWEAFDHYKQDWTNYGYGYLNAIPAQHPVLIEMYRAYNNEAWVWAPYYTIHKQLAGLIDIALLIDDPSIAAKAKLIATDMGLWVWNRLHYRTYVTTTGSQEERRARPGNRYEMWNMYIAGEVGGMSESLARLAEMNRDDSAKAERLLEASGYFDAPAFFEPLAHNIDDIRTRHANQHIPMITGALREYRVGRNPYYYSIARNFWDMVQSRYVYSTGGVGNGEMFRQPYTQMLSMTTHPNADINETCCAYNLAKLTKDLACFTPDDAGLMDYYERVLYNQIIGSLHPTAWACTYQYAVGLHGQKPFGNETPQSTCCGGTGVENHVKYQEAAYLANDTCLWVSLYLPTEVNTQQLAFTQTCSWPAEHSEITFLRSECPVAVKLRVPYWATDGFTIRLNGRTLCEHPQPSSYFTIPARRWEEGDRISIDMPFTVHVNFGPDKMDIAATDERGGRRSFPAEWLGTLMCGPLAMATPDATTWEETEITVRTDLSDIKRADDSEGLVTLTVAGKHFYPDYSFSTPSTHYLRLHVDGNKKKQRKAHLDRTALATALQLAEERLATPQRWAPHGLKKMQTAYDAARQGSTAKVQRDIDALTAELNMTLNSMRPSHLAEPEDLAELEALLHSNRSINDDARRYANMVIRYVRDGSGTPDMIEKAVNQIKATP
ncbi:MAG: glycoside hydrolase family 127 protein [Bacteroidaceae bacterium]|nr:glycoside hydrolase family 127 protein [Bacteroidaceae bacterium]